MKDHETVTCPDCGTCYPEGDFGGMCPGCLLFRLDEEESGWTMRKGAQIDNYTLVEMIGEGGMGSVWRAEQAEPITREVALKLIKPGMDTSAVLKRFDAERQILADLDHENIAKIYDAGASSNGLPYFVMELVTGLPITEFCNLRQLSLNDRLTLFVQVCETMQYAHTKGVVHRDLKPSNILVADNASLKIIDFGVAKAAGPECFELTLFNLEDQIVGTPGYMSPEQAEGSAGIDGRADVYSLGALLYEMLSGTPPFSRETMENAGLLEVIRIVKEVEPPPPSHYTNQASDLDWITLKALAKDPASRYQTPSEFVDDIDRYLKGKRVTASAPGVGSRLRKFRKAHPIVTWSALCIVPLVAATVFMTKPAEKTNPFAPVVTSLADSGAGSLRNAIAKAKPKSEIHFAPELKGKTLMLKGGALVIEKDLHLFGDGVTIDAGGDSRIFEVRDGTVTLSGFNMINGDAGDEGGGAIFIQGRLTLSECTFRENRARDGGAILNVRESWLRVLNCYFEGNTATESGGAAHVDSDRDIAFHSCTFFRNKAQAGGALFAIAAIHMENSTLTENRSAEGGGIATAANLGVFHCTIVRNHAPMDSDIHMSGGGYLFAYDSIFGVGVDSQRNNDGGGNLIAVDPQLAPLGDYGGPVPTMPPLAGSPAVDIGVTGFPFPVLKTDARGRPRSMDGDNDGIAKPDAGAAEYDPSSHTTP